MTIISRSKSLFSSSFWSYWVSAAVPSLQGFLILGCSSILIRYGYYEAIEPLHSYLIGIGVLSLFGSLTLVCLKRESPN